MAVQKCENSEVEGSRLVVADLGKVRRPGLERKRGNNKKFFPKGCFVYIVLEQCRRSVRYDDLDKHRVLKEGLLI